MNFLSLIPGLNTRRSIKIHGIRTLVIFLRLLITSVLENGLTNTQLTAEFADHMCSTAVTIDCLYVNLKHQGEELTEKVL